MRATFRRKGLALKKVSPSGGTLFRRILHIKLTQKQVKLSVKTKILTEK